MLSNIDEHDYVVRMVDCVSRKKFFLRKDFIPKSGRRLRLWSKVEIMVDIWDSKISYPKKCKSNNFLN